MKLSKRLKAIYDMVNSPCILADIGCDHAMLPIALMQSGKCEKAYACDIHIGPLQRGAKAIKEVHLEDRIHTVLSDGLQNVADDITCITIAGYGVGKYYFHTGTGHRKSTSLYTTCFTIE